MHYYGTRLSENISRREPEGYLLCLNVPVARTGTQEYLAEELGLPPRAGPVPVFRPENEVFAPETVASFEGMPVTNDHPPEGVDIGNIRALQKGHAHNVRRGSGEEADLLLADLIITDPGLIEAIMDGKREISCGYTYELCEEDGQYIQRKIRGNHVAVVDAGRAGPRVSIKDEQPSESLIRVTASRIFNRRDCPPDRSLVSDELISDDTSATGGRQRFAHIQPSIVARQSRSKDGKRRSDEKPTERRTDPMKKSLSKILARMAKDGDIETVAEIIEEMIAPETAAEEAAEAVAEAAPAAIAAAAAEAAPAAIAAAAAEAAETAEEPAAVVETPEATVVVDEAALGEVISRLDQIISLLAPAPAPATDEEPAEEFEEAVEAAAAEEEVISAGGEGISAEEIREMVGEILEPAVSEVIEESGDECDPGPEVISTGDALRAALRAVSPALAKMPKKQRQRVCADISARLSGKAGSRAADAGIYAALASASRKPEPHPGDLGKRIMATRSANRPRQ